MSAIGLAMGMVAAGSAMATDWPMFGYGVRHDGYNPGETAINVLTAPSLALRWTFNTSTYRTAQGLPVSAITKYIVPQPVFASALNVGGVNKDVLYIADNGGTLQAVDVNNVTNKAPALLWARSIPTVNTGCQQTGTPSGFKSTPLIDRTANGGRGVIYAAANATVYAYDLATGATAPGWPDAGLLIPNLNIPKESTFFSGLTLFNGKLYVAGSSNGCETVPYNGSINIIDVATVSVVGQWFTGTGNSTKSSVSGGSIWAPGGVTVDPDPVNPAIFTATGNPRPIGSQFIQRWFLTVLAARPDMSSIDWNWKPVDLGGDTDFGSSPVPIDAKACPYQLLPVIRKSGSLYVPLQTRANPRVLQRVDVYPYSYDTDVDYQAPAFDPVSQLIVVNSFNDGPAPYIRGVHAFSVKPDCTLSLAWQNNSSTDGTNMIAPGQRMTSVSIANGIAFVGAGANYTTANPVYGIYAVALQAGNGVGAGQTIWRSPNATASFQNAPIVVNGSVYGADVTGKVFAYSLNGK